MNKMGRGISLEAAMAVTGGIGSGKSSVARWLAQQWAVPVFDADDEVKFLLAQGQLGWSRLKDILDPTYFGNDSELLKAKLRQAIFRDDLLRKAVEKTIHPLVLRNLREKTAEFTLPCLVEVPLLYEANWQCYFYRVLVVHAENIVCINRVMARDGVSKAQVMAILGSQGSIQDKISRADFAIDNSGTWEDTLLLLEKIKNFSAHHWKKTLDTRCC